MRATIDRLQGILIHEDVFARRNFRPSADYPERMEALPIHVKLANALNALTDCGVQGLDVSDVARQANAWLSNADVWRQTATFLPADSKPFSYKVYEELVFFPKPSRVAELLGIGDVWIDACQYHNSGRLWERLHERTVFRKLTLETLLLSQLRLTAASLEWLMRVETSTTGDIICLPISRGRLGAGRHPYSTVHEAREVGGKLAPLWVGAFDIIGNPTRFAYQPGEKPLGIVFPNDIAGRSGGNSPYVTLRDGQLAIMPHASNQPAGDLGAMVVFDPLD